MSKNEYPVEYCAIVKTMRLYIDGSKQGKSEVMRPAFHPSASFFGYAGEQFAVGTQFLFDWIDDNGPAPKIEPRVVGVEILKTVAVVQLEVAAWSGKMAGSDATMSDLFTLLKMPPVPISDGGADPALSAAPTGNVYLAEHDDHARHALLYRPSPSCTWKCTAGRASSSVRPPARPTCSRC